MNKHVKVLLLMASAVSIAQANNTIAHTFFSVRPFYQNASPEKTSFFRDDMMAARDEGWGGALEVVVFGSKSANNDRLARYFTPYDKSCLNVVEFKNSTITPDYPLDPTREIEARNFNIETVNSQQNPNDNNAFRSTICFCPQQEVIGAGFTWKQALCRADDGWPTWWVEVSFPVLSVRNTMGLTEKVIENGGGAVTTNGLDDAPRVGNMIQAFKQDNWKYGRIVAGQTLSTTGIGDIEAKLGWLNMHQEGCSHWDTYIGFVFPAGNRPQAKYVFEPIRGNNHHFGFMYGSCLGLDAWECRDHKIVWEFNMNGRYLFSNTQVRSFDLRDKAWSRYIETYASLEDAQIASANFNTDSGTSGINLFTQCVRVSPRFQAEFNSAFIYSHCNWMVEVGYNFFGRHGELVELNDEWVEGPAIKDIGGQGITNFARTIQNNYPGSSIALNDYTPLHQKDLNLDSAAHPCVLSNILYGTVGYNWDCGCYPTFTALGASYEFTHGNNALERWLIWGKLGFAY